MRFSHASHEWRGAHGSARERRSRKAKVRARDCQHCNPLSWNSIRKPVLEYMGDIAIKKKFHPLSFGRHWGAMRNLCRSVNRPKCLASTRMVARNIIGRNRGRRSKRRCWYVKFIGKGVTSFLWSLFSFPRNRQSLQLSSHLHQQTAWRKNKKFV